MLAKKNKGWINQSCIRKTSEGLCCHPSFNSGSCALILFLSNYLQLVPGRGRGSKSKHVLYLFHKVSLMIWNDIQNPFQLE